MRHCLTGVLFLVTTALQAQALSPSAAYTRGIGHYPGAPSEFFGPVLKTCSPQQGELRNLALHRAAWASSAIDYNLTAHLVTDGIRDEATPQLLIATTPEGVLPRREAEWALDGGPYSNNVLMGAHTWICYEWTGGRRLSVRTLRLDARVAYDESRCKEGYRIVCQVSDDGQTWHTAGQLRGDGLPGEPFSQKLQSDPNKQTTDSWLPARLLEQSIRFDRPYSFSHLRLLLDMEGAVHWDLHDLHLLDNTGQEVWGQPSQEFCSMWMSNGGGRQWLEVDLGAPATVERIVTHWAEEPLRWHSEVSDDGRRVRLVMEEPNESGCYALRELEVWGRGGVECQPHSSTAPTSGRMELSGGRWQLQRASEVHSVGEDIATESFDSHDWIWATVPGTVLTSYINIGAVPDPNREDWVDQISESFFRSNFWYRHEFQVSAEWLHSGTLQRLHFDGINWKANVFLNGYRVGRVEGAFMRGDFDVSGLLREGNNVLAVEIICNDHFGVVKEKDENTTQFNGGILGADNPTFHATIGWDWITTVRGRNCGIWNEVSLTSESRVTLSDPYVQTQAGRQVSVRPSVFVRNHGSFPVHGTLEGWIGDVRFARPVSLAPGTEQEVVFAPEDFPQLIREDFRLWWPNGYGEPFRYDAGFTFQPSTADERPSTLTYKAGLRQMTYEGLADSVLIRINGRRFVPLGGNWGFDEHNLCYRRREYDIAVGYHRDMHCTMIRNWVGMIGDESFYEACDSLGVMVWQDFWLANPVDGPNPYDEALFLRNAEDYVRRIRSHASIGLFCGRNEGYPPPNIERGLRRYVDELAPGLAYIPSSADDGVTGHGPYCALPAKTYFQRQSGKLHTERGMPAVMNIESLRRTIAADSLWPQSRQWGQHDYTLLGAQRAREFNALVAKAMGAAANAETFARYAQLINYNGYRAMFESAACKRAGLLIWMSHPCWPSMVWQTYDYYFDPTAAYFGVKKACEPLHIQYNALTDSVEIVNYCAGHRPRLEAEALVFDLNGRRVARRTARLSSSDDSTQPWLRLSDFLAVPPSEVYFLRLRLTDAGKTVSENTYIMGREPENYQALQTLPLPDVQQNTTIALQTDRQPIAYVTLRNKGRTPAPLLRLNLKGADGEQILPAIYSDNYITLLPGEECKLTITWKQEDSRGQQVHVEVTSLLDKGQ